MLKVEVVIRVYRFDLKFFCFPTTFVFPYTLLCFYLAAYTHIFQEWDGMEWTAIDVAFVLPVGLCSICCMGLLVIAQHSTYLRFKHNLPHG